tara:strand:- start:741 stop:950 length:210 start_codon:yes stop_codon:yes gene_type:complete
MKFKVPNQNIIVRLFERVNTSDNQYDVFDIGIEQPDGSIDSIALGGSFANAKAFIQNQKAKVKKVSESG